MNSVRSWLALVKFHVAACITTVRWRFVLPVYIVVFISFIVDIRRERIWGHKLGGDANVWDVGLWFVEEAFNDGFFVLLGFMLLVGDDLVRGHKDGTLRSTLVYSRSTWGWWSAKIVSMGVLMMAYMSAIFVSMLVASLVMRVPMGLHDSAVSLQMPAWPRHERWYYLPAGWSTLGYFSFAMFSLAFTSWVIAVVHQVVSLFVFPNGRIPFVIFFGWLILGFVVQAHDALWDVRFWLYPGKCFEEFGRGFIPIPVFFGAMAMVLMCAAALGYNKLRRMDL